MIPSMIAMVTIPSAASGVRKVRISVPRIECLLDNQRYFLPGDLPPAAGEDLRPMVRPRITKAPRAPSLRTLVKTRAEMPIGRGIGPAAENSATSGSGSASE